jgi:hypothetical protein
MAKVKKPKKKPLMRKAKSRAPKPRNPVARDLASPLFRPRVVKKKSRRAAQDDDNLASLLDPDA